MAYLGHSYVDAMKVSVANNKKWSESSVANNRGVFSRSSRKRKFKPGVEN